MPTANVSQIGGIISIPTQETDLINEMKKAKSSLPKLPKNYPHCDLVLFEPQI